LNAANPIWFFVIDLSVYEDDHLLFLGYQGGTPTEIGQFETEAEARCMASIKILEETK